MLHLLLVAGHLVIKYGLFIFDKQVHLYSTPRILELSTILVKKFAIFSYFIFLKKIFFNKKI